MSDFTTKPSMPNARSKNNTKVPNRPAFDPRAGCQFTNGTNWMSAPIPT